MKTPFGVSVIGYMMVLLSVALGGFIVALLPFRGLTLVVLVLLWLVGSGLVLGVQVTVCAFRDARELEGWFSRYPSVMKSH